MRKWIRPIRFHVRLLLVSALLTLLVSGVASAQDDTRDLRFFLPFIPNIQFSAVYVAIEKGYFAEQGLDVSLEYGDEHVAVDLIAADEIKFALVSGEQVILARAGGRQIVYVYEWFQNYPVGIVIPDTTEGVETVADLAGRRVGIPGRFGASYSGLIALLAAFDMEETDIQLEPIGFVAPDVVCAGGVEASVIYVNNEPLQIQQRADAGDCGDITSVEVIRIADHINMISNGVVTNEVTIADEPDLVEAFVTAFHNGLRDSINNPAEAYLLSLRYVENLPINDELRAVLDEAAANQAEFLAENPDVGAIADSRAELRAELRDRFDDELLIQFYVLIETIGLLDAPELGFTDEDSWAFTLDVVASMGLVAGEVDLEGAFTNRFVPEAGTAGENEG
jgi:NitT/TauT family transport system substrate-binding protein